MVGVAANGVDDVVDHLHPMCVQRHWQVDVGRRFEPVPLVPVLDCQGGDDEVTTDLGQEIDAKVLGHLQLLLQYVLVSSGSPSVGQLNDGGDHLGAVGEAVLRLLRHQVLEVGAEGHHHDGVDLEDCTIAGLQGPVRELVRLLQIVERQAIHTLHSSLTVALGIPEHDNVTKPNIDWMQITNLIFLSFILDEEEEVISNVSPQARRLRNCHYHLLHGIISLSSLNVFVLWNFRSYFLCNCLTIYVN